MLLYAVLVLQAQDAARLPRRSVADSGVIATDQRVTPAGVQTVFAGRVTGVRFGAEPGDLWAVVAGSAYHLAWADDRVIARGALTGRSGVQGVAIDPVRNRALVASVGSLPAGLASSRLPGTQLPVGAHPVAHLTAFDASAHSDSTPAAWSSGALGVYMAGAPATAKRANASARRVVVVPLPADDALAVVDADSGGLLRTVHLGVAPIAAALAADGSVAYVTNLGGAQPRPAQRSAIECCDPRAERVRIDARGIAAPGSVSRVDVAAGRVTHTIGVGRHPTGIAWDEARSLLYVADGNDDAITVIETRSNTSLGTIAVAPFRERRIGLAPTAVALGADGRTLLVTLGGANAVAVYDVSSIGRTAGTSHVVLKGLIPTGWYPSSVDVSADGKYLAVGALLGVGSGEGEAEEGGKRGRYVHAVRGSVNVISLPTDAELAAYTAAVAANDHLTLAGAPERASSAPRRGVAARPIPERPGEPTPIRHVVFIVKENRTYDQVLGDLSNGDGDSSLVMYGRDVTPNQHALAEQFVLLDRTFANGGNSADGHQWLTQANETEYAMWPLYFGRSYPSEGIDPLAYSSGGFLWETARAKGKSVAVFGEYATTASDSVPAVRARLLADYRETTANRPRHFRQVLASRYHTRSAIPSLDRLLVREYPGWTQEVPDVVKAEVVLDHLHSWEATNTMPDLVMIILPNDHTVGTKPAWNTPRAHVADNDLGLGKIVDGLTHSPFWKSTAIFVIEDDAQDGVDHVDGHRTVALAISPYARRGAIDHTFYNQTSMVKTVELILGLPPLSLFDLVAPSMRASFIAPTDPPDNTPFTAIEPKQSIYDVNQSLGAIRGAHARERLRAAVASSRMRFDGPDEAPADALNRILWHDAKGWSTPYPRARHSLFFPMSVELDDEDRVPASARARQSSSTAPRAVVPPR